jgi:hypothetical protein
MRREYRPGSICRAVRRRVVPSGIVGARPTSLANGIAVLALILGMSLAAADAASASRWSVLRVSRPAGSIASELGGVSCASRRWCVAVGSYERRRSGSVALAERWNGSGWSILPTPRLSGSRDSGFHAVSCRSSSVCVAVGWDRNRALAERWNGRHWAVVPGTAPTNAKLSELLGVSCVSARSCVAVGTIGANYTPHGPVALVERWNGSTWSIRRVRRVAEADLQGVSCPSPKVCVAVGSWSQGTLVERWDGTRWRTRASRESVFNYGDLYELHGVSCPSRRACIAVGDSADSGGYSSIDMRWNGMSWTKPGLVPGYEPLLGVSCPSATFCVAVGTVNVSYNGGRVTSALRWNGAEWSPELARFKSGVTFEGISCPSPTVCLAVGSRPDRNFNNVLLAARRT